MNPVKNRPPAYQLYAAEWLAETSEMSCAEAGAFQRLMCHQWLNGGLPPELDRISRLAGDIAEASLSYILTKFPVGQDGIRRNQNLETVRQKQAAFSEERKRSGSAGAEKRWKGRSANGSAIAQPQNSQCQNHGLQSSSSSPLGDGTDHAREADLVPIVRGSSSTQVNPTMEEAKAYADRNGVLPECAEKWFLDHDARGWVDRAGQPIIHWKSSVLAYAVQWRANAARDAANGKTGHRKPQAATMKTDWSDPKNNRF